MSGQLEKSNYEHKFTAFLENKLIKIYKPRY